MVFFGFLFEDFPLGLKGFLGVLCVGKALVEFVVLLVEGVFLLLEALLSLTDLGVLFVDVFLVVCLELEEFLLGLEDFLVLDVLCFDAGLFYYGLALTLEGTSFD